MMRGKISTAINSQRLCLLLHMTKKSNFLISHKQKIRKI